MSGPMVEGGCHTEETRLKMSITRKGRPSYFKGKHHTEYAKQLASQANKGRKLSEETRAKIARASAGNSYALGYKHTAEARAKISKAHQGKWVGENSPNWLGGKSFEPYTKEFNNQLRYLIRVRDGFACQLCGIPERETGKKLPIHHIDYDKSNSMPTNLISLCAPCNSKANKNREYWTNYFRELLNKRQLNPKALVKKRQKNKPEMEILKLVNLGVNL